MDSQHGVGWSSSWVLGKGLTTSHHKNKVVRTSELVDSCEPDNVSLGSVKGGELLASQEGHFSMELVGWLVCHALVHLQIKLFTDHESWEVISRIACICGKDTQYI